MKTSVATAMPYSGFHGDDGVELDMDAALDDVCETLMLFRQFPAPRQIWRNGRFEPKYQRIQFDMREWVAEHIDPAEMIDLYLSMLTDYSNEHDARRMQESARVEKMLRDELEGSALVRERAEEMAEESHD